MPGQILAMAARHSELASMTMCSSSAAPRVCFVPTASAYPETMLLSFYEPFARRAEPSHVLGSGPNELL